VVMPNASECPQSGMAGLAEVLLSGPALFRRPGHPAPLPMLGRLPVLFWLVGLLQPRRVVQIGLGDGLVCMALCQATSALDGETTVLGLDPGQPAGAAAVLPAPFAASHGANYADLAVLEGADPLDAAAARHPAPAEGDIDLLVLAAPLDAAQRQALAAHWLPRLSARAVILTCGAVGQGASASFGDAPVIALPPLPGAEAEGMVLTLHGANQPKVLRALAEGGGDAVLRGAFLLFDMLGQGLVAASEAEALRDAHRRDSAALTAARHEAVALRAALEAAEARGARAEAETGAALARLADLAAAHNADIARSLAGSATEGTPGGDMGARYAARLEDIAALTQEFTDRRETDLARISELQQKLVTTDRALQATRADKATLERRVRAMETSTSWRLTRPVRGLKRLFSRVEPGGSR